MCDERGAIACLILSKQIALPLESTVLEAAIARERWVWLNSCLVSTETHWQNMVELVESICAVCIMYQILTSNNSVLSRMDGKGWLTMDFMSTHSPIPSSAVAFLIS